MNCDVMNAKISDSGMVVVAEMVTWPQKSPLSAFLAFSCLTMEQLRTC